jgi:CheY-like chemotaxis protein
MEERKKIFLVDDEEETLILLANILKRNGYDVITASRGKDVVELTKKIKPDLIILDIIMPDMSGADVSAALDNDPETREVPIIYLTASMTKEQEAEHRDTVLRHINMVAKPVTEEELLRIKFKV